MMSSCAIRAARGAAAVLLLLASWAAMAGPSCSAQSGPQLLPLVELFTSEGCDSCPPADRLLSATFPAEGSTARASVLAFHVDYWDRLGWKDRFAAPAHTQRQYAAMRAASGTFVYTPQLLVQGQDVAPGSRDRIAALVAAAAARPARATIALDIAADATRARIVRATATVPAGAVASHAQLWIAYTESGLVSDVRAGENRGARLAHDHVVRAWLGPFPADAKGAVDATVTIRRPAERGRMPAVVAVLLDEKTGEVLQSLTSHGCGAE
jgi:hypothetical protein